MTSNNQQQSQITAEEIGEKWGRLLTQAFGLNMTLEKQLANCQQTIRQLTESELAMQAEIAKLRHQLSNVPRPLSPEAAEIAAAAKEIIETTGEAKEIAASTGAAI
jgi:regulator of replication initiation timing